MQFGDETQLFTRQTSLLTSAEAADQHYASCSLSLERLSSSESQTRAKITKILLANQESYDRQQLDRVLAQLQVHKQNEEKCRQQIEGFEQRIKNDAEGKDEIFSQLNWSQKLEVCEAHNGTLLCEKAGLTAELTAAQAQIRRLYKELQQRKNQQQTKYAYDQARARYQRPLLTPPELWENGNENVRALCNEGRSVKPLRESSLVKLKPPVVPRESGATARLQSTPLKGSDSVEEKEYLSDNVEILLTVDEKNTIKDETKDTLKSRLSQGE